MQLIPMEEFNPLCSPLGRILAEHKLYRRFLECFCDSRNRFSGLLPCKEKLNMNVKMEGDHLEGPWQTKEMPQRNFMKFGKRDHEVLDQGRKLSQVGV